jgi:hypothetical protein
MSPSSFSDVLEAELAFIRRRRFCKTPARRVKDGLVGLALSGGGIRSATTNLGVLQTLAKLRLLPLVDYMCTVSGGGYIGSCLSSLLSLDTATPPQPLQTGATPMFTTDWDRFPFNPDTTRGRAQIRHLRTHGSFLVTRKGAFKRETLRGIGQLLSGTVYHLVLALLTLSAVALLYMTILFYGSPQVDEALREVTLPVRTYVTAYESKEDAIAPPRYKAPSITELTGKGATTVTIPTSYVYPGLWERVKAKGTIIRGQLKEIDRRQLEWTATTAAFGAVVSIVAFCYLWRYKSIAPHLTPQSPARPGESAEDALAVRVLRWAGWVSLIAMLLWLAGTLWWIGPAKPPLWLILPIVAIAAIRVTGWILHILMPMMNGAWTRDMRSLWGAYQATRASTIETVFEFCFDGCRVPAG